MIIDSVKSKQIGEDFERTLLGPGGLWYNMIHQYHATHDRYDGTVQDGFSIIEKIVSPVSPVPQAQPVQLHFHSERLVHRRTIPNTVAGAAVVAKMRFNISTLQEKLSTQNRDLELQASLSVDLENQQLELASILSVNQLPTQNISAESQEGASRPPCVIQ